MQTDKVTFAIGTPHGSFRLTVADGDIGPDGEPITAKRAAGLIVSRGFVRGNSNEYRGEAPRVSPGLHAKHAAEPVPSRAETLDKALRELLEG